MLARLFAKALTEHGDVARETDLLDHDIRPYGPKQFVFAHNVAAPAHKSEEDV
jgi:hypothetical protein